MSDSVSDTDPSPSTILVVDDTEANREALRRRLERRGYTVIEADSGEQALALIDQQPIDLILLDIMMPGVSGIDVLKKVRATKSPAELPIIMATAKDATEDVVGALFPAQWDPKLGIHVT